MIAYNLNNIINGQQFELNDAKKRFPKYVDILTKLDDLADHGRYDIQDFVIVVIQNQAVPVWRVTRDDDEQYFIFLDSAKRNVATLEDIEKIKPLTAKALNHSRKWKITSINDEKSSEAALSAKNDGLIIIDVYREVLNAYNNVKKKDIVPFNVVAKAATAWLNKAINDKKIKILAKVLAEIYKQYDIDTYKHRGSWKNNV